MRLTDFLQEVGKPIAYYASVARLCGGVQSGILLCQLLYWHDKTENRDGWLYKTRIEIELETALSRWEQETARTKLKALGFLSEKFADNPRKLYYRLNLEVINNAWEAALTLHKVEIPHTSEPASILHKVEIPPTIRWENHQQEGGKTTSSITESTTENKDTTPKPPSSASTESAPKKRGRQSTPKHPLPDGYTPSESLSIQIRQKFPGANVEMLTEKMRNWAISNGAWKSDWNATLRNFAQTDWERRGSPEHDLEYFPSGEKRGKIFT